MAVRARAQVVLPYFSNLPEDVVTNTFHFEDLTTLDLEALADAVTPSLGQFYSDWYSATNPYPAYLAAPATWHVNWYDLADPPPRPVYTLPLPVVGLSTSPSSIPLEVAVVLSFQGDALAGVPQARRRGRVYLGALGPNAITTGTASSFPHVNTAIVLQLVAAAVDNLLAPSLPAGRWVVYSPTTDSTTLITNGWVDNEPDTQRRRGVAATSRTIYP